MVSARRVPAAAAELEQAIADAAHSFRSPSRPGSASGIRRHYDEARILATSAVADAALITWHVLYWSGRRPAAVARSRGSSYRVWELPSSDPVTVRIVDHFDHREGVTGWRS